MREIKFRAWIKSREEWWRVAGFAIDSNKEKIRLWRMNDEMPDGMGTELFQFSDVVLGQYVGLEDIDGVEIYEDDIVFAHANGASYLVRHGIYRHCNIDLPSQRANCYGWFIGPIPELGAWGESIEQAGEFLKVIGNAHENPDLLPVY